MEKIVAVRAENPVLLASAALLALELNRLAVQQMLSNNCFNA